MSKPNDLVKLAIKPIHPNIIKFPNSLTPLKPANVKNIVLHHSGGANSDIPMIHNMHLKNGWTNGFGYNYYVRKDGTIYEGRGMNEGAQTLNMNGVTIGICCEGNYDLEVMSSVMFESLKKIITYVLQTVSGLSLNPNKIELHKTFCNTDCPGANLSSQIGKIRRECGLMISSNIQIQNYAAGNSNANPGAPPVHTNNVPYFIYTVAKNDTWDIIAKKLGVSKQTLFDINNVNQATKLFIGYQYYSPSNLVQNTKEYLIYMENYARSLYKGISVSYDMLAQTPPTIIGYKDLKINNVMGDDIRNNVSPTKKANVYSKFKLQIDDGSNAEIIQFQIDPNARSESFSNNITPIETKEGFILSKRRSLDQGSLSGYFLDMNGVSEKDDMIRQYKKIIEENSKISSRMLIEGQWLLVEITNINISENASNNMLKNYTFSYIIVKDSRAVTSRVGVTTAGAGTTASAPNAQTAKPTTLPAKPAAPIVKPTGKPAAPPKTATGSTAKSASQKKADAAKAAKAAAAKKAAAEKKKVVSKAINGKIQPTIKPVSYRERQRL